MSRPEQQHGARTPTPHRGVEYALSRKRARYETEVSKLLDATLMVMREQETADPTVNDILRRAGLSTAAFYRHFPTKEDLFVTLLTQAHDMTAAHIEARVSAADGPLEQIELWIRAMFDLVRTDEALALNRPLLLAHPRLFQQFPHEISTGFGVLAWPLQAAIGDARADAGLPPGDPPLDGRLALNQVFGILIDAAGMGTPPSGEIVDAVVSYTIRAVLGVEPARLKPPRVRTASVVDDGEKRDRP